MDETKQATDTSRIEVAMRGIARELNSKDRTPAKPAPPMVRSHNEGLPHFVALSRQLGEALIEVAQQQVTRAQNNLEDVTRWTEAMQAEAQKKWEEMQAMERKFEDYRSYVLQANDRFNGK